MGGGRANKRKNGRRIRGRRRCCKKRGAIGKNAHEGYEG
jgi:hypothetical protein